MMMPWLFILYLVVLLLMHGATSSNYVYPFCQVKNSYASGSAFEANLNNTLFTKLLPNASMVGFSNSTQGFGEDKVYALFYCRGDLDTHTCQECVENATRKITEVCKFSKEGIVWFEECTLRYANRAIFSIDELGPYYSYRNTTGIVNEYDLDPYNETFDSTMDALVEQAAYGKGALPGFATKELNVSSTGIIRGLAQCTPDIVGPGCYRCLKDALRLRDTWANTMMFLPSCLFRYDLYKTVSPPAPPPPPTTFPVTHPAPPPPPTTFPASYIALITASGVFVLAVIGGTLLWKCRYNANASGDIVARRPDRDEPKPPDRVQSLIEYTFEQVKHMTKGFKTKVGEGGFGEVYRGLLIDGITEVAVKVLNKRDANTQFNNEIDVFVRSSHNNLVSLLGYCQEGTRLALIYEYMNNGDLRDLLSNNAKSLSWIDRLQIAIDTAEGLHYLHRNCNVRIVHRDVKPANILINQNLRAKVADFGLSKIFPENDDTGLKSRVINSPGYTAPEYSRTGRVHEKIDIYSFGVVLVELITGIVPSFGIDAVKSFVELFNTGDIKRILDSRMRRTNEQTMQVPNEGSAWEATELARRCVEEDEKNRPDMWEVIVTLKDCLNREVNKNTRSSASTSVEHAGPIIPDDILMEPEAI